MQKNTHFIYPDADTICMRASILVLVLVIVVLLIFPVYCVENSEFSDPDDLVMTNNTTGEKIVVFTGPVLNIIRKNAKNRAYCPQLDDYYQEDNCSGKNCTGSKSGWILYPCDPTAILQAFPHLTLDKDKQISGYYYREFAGGNSKLGIFDKGAKPVLPDNITTYSVFDDIPVGDPQIMRYISGDKSPESYLEASLLSREIPEIGAFWHGLDWSDHEIIDDTRLSDIHTGENRGLSSLPSLHELNSSRWAWSDDKPVSYNPVVTTGKENVTVQFFTYSYIEMEKIVRHTDLYIPGSYDPVTNETILATGDAGIMY